MLQSKRAGSVARDGPTGGKGFLAQLRAKTSVSASATPAYDDEQENELLAKRPKECDQCQQNTHQYDQDCLPRHVYLKWVKFTTNTQGQKLPAGRECYNCFDVRRRFYGQCDLDTLIDSRRQNEVEDERFKRLRKDKASGENRLRREAITEIKQKVSNQDETFEEAFEEGTFVPLQTFAKQKSIDPELCQNEELLIRHIEKRWQFEVGFGKSGCKGVFVTELGDGEYKFKRGVKMSAARHKEQYYDDDVAAQEGLEEILGGLSATNLWGGDSGDEGAELPARLTASNMAASVGRLMPGPLDPNASALSPVSHATTTPSLISSVSSTTVPSSASFGLGPVAAARCHSDGELEQDSRPAYPIPGRRRPGRDVGDVTAAGVADSGKRRKKGRGSLAIDEVVESGHQLLMDVQQQLSAEALWDRRVRSRDFENTLAKLSAKASKLAHIVHNDQAAALSESLFNASTSIEEQRGLFSELRSSPERYTTHEMHPKDLAIFKRLPLNLKSNILVSMGFTCLNTSEVGPHTIVQAVRVARFGCPNMACIAALGDMRDAAVHKTACQVQQSIFTACMDKVVKKHSQRQFIQVLRDLRDANLLPPHMTISEMQALNVEDLAFHATRNGWSNQCALDLLAMEFLAEALRAIDEGKGMKREGRTRAEAFIQVKREAQLTIANVHPSSRRRHV